MEVLPLVGGASFGFTKQWLTNGLLAQAQDGLPSLDSNGMIGSKKRSFSHASHTFECECGTVNCQDVPETWMFERNLTWTFTGFSKKLLVTKGRHRYERREIGRY